MERFYADLPPFRDFVEFADLDAYRPVPADWVVMAADVRGSTDAIAAGRYKDVNMVGAACIIAILNACGETEVPFVFGGDGATVVVPGSLADAAKQALAGVRILSRERFGLELRVGAVDVADLRARGTDVLVRKYQLSPGNYLAMFAGHGVELAESWIKDDTHAARYGLAEPEEEPDLDGLSCRWEPLIPQGGRMATLMLRGTADQPAAERQLMRDVVHALTEILGGDPRAAAPASPHSMRFRWPPRGLWLEALAIARGKSVWRQYLNILIESLIQYGCERLDKQAGAYNAPVYREELRANTDFRKYDDTLRMVLDVTEEQVAAIEAYLEGEYQAGRLIYGIHVTDRALMTCLVFSLEQSEHVHFIDGSDGGFAVAATGFKRRLAERENRSG